MKGRKTTEDYLKTIYTLQQKQDVHACLIAEEMGLSRPTVSAYLKRFQKDGYITVESGKTIRLTQKGLEIAVPVLERYRILRQFLIGLGVDEAAAHRDACEMEHGLGEESYRALKKLTIKYHTSDK